MRVTKWFSGTGLVLLALAVLFSTLFSDWALKGARIDLTEGSLYTLSDGSKNIIGELEQPLDLYFFFSQSSTRDALGWRSYAKQVRELLEEYELQSDGKIRLTVIDPEPFSEDEDRASAFGLQAVPVGKGDPIYFGLVAQYGELKEGAKPEENERATLEIPFFQPERQAFLEYDIAKMIYQVSQPRKPTIGLISGLELEGGFDMMSRQPTPAWFSVTQIKQLFDVQSIGNAEEDISNNDYDLLVVIHPVGLSQQTLFAIDQFVLKGGRALFFVDPFSELDRMNASKASDDLNKLFNAWGVSYKTDQFVGDAQLALQVGGQGVRPVRHLGILQLTDQNLVADNQITSQLETLHFSSAGFLTHMDDAKTEFEPLFLSSEYAMPMAASKLTALTDPKTLAVGFNPSGEKYVLAARVTGSVSSAFPDGVPIKEGGDDADAEASGEEASKDSDEQVSAEATSEAEKVEPEYLTESSKPINVVIVADSDVLSDRLWVRVQDFFGQQVAQPFADNGDFFFNTVDLLAGSADLISIRGQGRYFRPFTVVKEMQREAESRFRQVEQDLQAQLQQIEVQLAELQSQQGDASDVITLTPEVEAKLMQFQQEKLVIRKKLRDVQHQLNKDIEQLDFTLKLINIALVPLLLTIVVVVIALLRRRKR